VARAAARRARGSRVVPRLRVVLFLAPPQHVRKQRLVRGGALVEVIIISTRICGGGGGSGGGFSFARARVARGRFARGRFARCRLALAGRGGLARARGGGLARSRRSLSRARLGLGALAGGLAFGLLARLGLAPPVVLRLRRQAKTDHRLQLVAIGIHRATRPPRLSERRIARSRQIQSPSRGGGAASRTRGRSELVHLGSASRDRDARGRSWMRRLSVLWKPRGRKS